MRSLGDFLGAWTLRRCITDADGTPVATFAGVARLHGDTVSARWHEIGRLCPQGATPLTARRRYIWRARPDGTIGVLFADGRPFHDLDPANDTAQAVHHCPPDDYAVTYDFSNWPNWQTIWHVQGPRKRLTIATRHAPGTACAAFAAAANTAENE